MHSVTPGSFCASDTHAFPEKSCALVLGSDPLPTHLSVTDALTWPCALEPRVCMLLACGSGNVCQWEVGSAHSLEKTSSSLRHVYLREKQNQHLVTHSLQRGKRSPEMEVIQEKCRCGTYGRGLVLMVGVGWWLYCNVSHSIDSCRSEPNPSYKFKGNIPSVMRAASGNSLTF